MHFKGEDCVILIDVICFNFTVKNWEVGFDRACLFP